MGRKKNRKIRVALVKAEFAWSDIDANLKLLKDLLLPLKGGKIDVVITPECFLDGYMVRNRTKCTVRKLKARCVSGPGDARLKTVRSLARTLNAYIAAGVSEKRSDGAVRNAAYLYDRQGKPVGTYYKVQPCEYYVPGTDLPVFKTDFGMAGIVICADRRWPENIRVMKVKGAEIILNPTWGWKGDLNTAIIRTRAYENGIPVCFAHPAEALVCLPDGSIGAELSSSEPGVLVHDIDLSANVAARITADKAGSHPATNRRPELYGPLTE